MHKMSVIGLGLCLFVGIVSAEEVRDEQLEELNRQYTEQFLVYLETSEHELLRVASAIHLLQADDPSKNARGEKLVSDALKNPDIDATALWWIALDCRWRAHAEWCESGEALERLQKADSKNAAVQVLKLSNENKTLSDEEKNQLLMNMAEAERYDVHWGRGVDKAFEEALAYVELNEAPPTPVGAPIEVTPLIHAFTLNTYFWITSSIASTTPPYQEILELCREQPALQDTEGFESCKKLARIMQEHGATTLTRRVGFEIEKAILESKNPDDPKIHALDQRKQAHQIMNRCFAQHWVNDPERWPSIETARMMNFFKNLDELSEWDGYKLSLQQEYEVAPENYPVNPADCNAILEMDDASLDKFMDGRTDKEVWEQMQADAKSELNQ